MAEIKDILPEINALAKKSKTVGLTEEEKARQKGPQARPQRPLPLRQNEGRRQQETQVQGMLREKRMNND